jgi:Zn-dependent peptidase ImmA (M78 family)/transcriptional regulator with XRE-family HTH domain
MKFSGQYGITMTSSAELFQFPDRAAGVVPQRIAEARTALQMSRADVARELNVTGTAIGHYENGDRRPDMSTLLRLAHILRQPVSFFFRDLAPVKNKRQVRFFRSVGPKSNKINMSLDVRADWLWEFVQMLLSAGIRLPTPNVPLFDDVSGDGGYSPEQMEYLASRIRRQWGLGDGPINNMIALLETNGVIVSRFDIGSTKIDAFSCWIDGRPYVILGSDKTSSVRSRFDAAHELGHLLLHRSISADDMEDKSVRERIEMEANFFAGAFLLPRDAIYREFYSTRVSHLMGLKQRWLVSMQAIVRRARDIGAIDENQYVGFRIQLTKRKELKAEPLDDVIPLERPGLLFNAWKKLVESGRLPGGDPDEALGLSADVLQDHFGRPVAPAAERQNSAITLFPK